MPRVDPPVCPRHQLRLSEAQVAAYKVASSLYYPASSAPPAATSGTLSEPSGLILARVNVDCKNTTPISRALKSGVGGSDGAGTRPEGGDHSGQTNRGRHLGWWRARLLVCVLYLAVLLGLIIYIETARLVMVPITVFLIVLSLALFVIILFCVCFVVFL